MSSRAAPVAGAVAVTFALAATALAAAGCSRAAASDVHPADSVAIPVVVRPVAPSLRAGATTASGIVHAKTSVDVAFQVGGKVVLVGPDEGQAVRAGQVIAGVDSTDYRLSVDQADAQADRAAGDLRRSRPLLTAGSIAAADIDHLESGERQAVAALGLAKKRLSDTRLAAPISGVIARRAVEVGATVAAGQPVFTIVDLDPVRVRIGVPESDVGSIAVGAPAQVRIPALGDNAFTGRVSLIGVAADPTARTYTVEISVPNPRRVLRAGMVAEATISTGQRAESLMIPAVAVVHDGGLEGATYVYTLDADGARVHARRVTTGVARGDSLEVTNGLSAGDRVVVAGQQRLREGARVQLASAGGVEP